MATRWIGQVVDGRALGVGVCDACFDRLTVTADQWNLPGIGIQISPLHYM
jgi:hypothetical protein